MSTICNASVMRSLASPKCENGFSLGKGGGGGGEGARGSSEAAGPLTARGACQQRGGAGAGSSRAGEARPPTWSGSSGAARARLGGSEAVGVAVRMKS